MGGKTVSFRPGSFPRSTPRGDRGRETSTPKKILTRRPPAPKNARRLTQVQPDALPLYGKIPPVFPKVSEVELPEHPSEGDYLVDPRSSGYKGSALDTFLDVHEDRPAKPGSSDEDEELDSGGEADIASINMFDEINRLPKLTSSGASSLRAEFDVCTLEARDPAASKGRSARLSSQISPHSLRHGKLGAGFALLCATSTSVTLLLGWHPYAILILVCWLLAALAFVWFYCRRMLILFISLIEGSSVTEHEVEVVDFLPEGDDHSIVSFDPAEDLDDPLQEEIAAVKDADQERRERVVQEFLVRVNEVREADDDDEDAEVFQAEVMKNRPKPRDVRILVAPDDDKLMEKCVSDVAQTTRAARPYVPINFFDIHPTLALVDSGSNISVLDIFTWSAIRDKLAKK